MVLKFSEKTDQLWYEINIQFFLKKKADIIKATATCYISTMLFSNGFKSMRIGDPVLFTFFFAAGSSLGWHQVFQILMVQTLFPQIQKPLGSKVPLC